jgi:hypothetical protein
MQHQAEQSQVMKWLFLQQQLFGIHGLKCYGMRAVKVNLWEMEAVSSVVLTH